METFARLTIEGTAEKIDASITLRWVDVPNGEPTPVLYRNGKRVTRAWRLEMLAENPADVRGGNANTE